MRVGIIQSSYVPWRGYFDFIRSVDLFVFYDDVAYSKGSWRNRNQVKTAQGLKWLTVPVNVHSGETIDAVTIATGGKDWRQAHEGLIRQSLSDAPYCGDALEIWRQAVAAGHSHLSPLNQGFIRAACAYLGIATPIINSRDIPVGGRSTERLINMLQALGADRYLSGPSADAYLDKGMFAKAGIQLEYKTYAYAPYPQSWGEFAGNVAILDLIAHVGPQAHQHLASQRPDQVIVPWAATVS